MSVVDDPAILVASIDGFSVFIALTPLENLVNVGRGRIAVEKLMILIMGRLAVEENCLVRRQRALLRVGPAAVVPDDLGAIHGLSEHLVQQATDIV